MKMPQHPRTFVPSTPGTHSLAACRAKRRDAQTGGGDPLRRMFARAGLTLWLAACGLAPAQGAIEPALESIPQAQGGATLEAPAQAAAVAALPAVAVLDFETATVGDGDVDALSQALWTHIGANREFGMLPREATRRWLIRNDLMPGMPYAPAVPLDRVASALRVDFLVAGRIDRVEGTYALTLSLLDAHTRQTAYETTALREANLTATLSGMEQLAGRLRSEMRRARAEWIHTQTAPPASQQPGERMPSGVLEPPRAAVKAGAEAKTRLAAEPTIVEAPASAPSTTQVASAAAASQATRKKTAATETANSLRETAREATEQAEDDARPVPIAREPEAAPAAQAGTAPASEPEPTAIQAAAATPAATQTEDSSAAAASSVARAAKAQAPEAPQAPTQQASAPQRPEAALTEPSATEPSRSEPNAPAAEAAEPAAPTAPEHAAEPARAAEAASAPQAEAKAPAAPEAPRQNAQAPEEAKAPTAAEAPVAEKAAAEKAAAEKAVTEKAVAEKSVAVQTPAATPEPTAESKAEAKGETAAGAEAKPAAGDAAEARKLLEQAKKLQRGQQRLDLLQRAAESNVADPEPWRALAGDHYALKQFDKTVAACDQGLNTNPKNSTLLTIKSSALFELKQYEGALEASRAALAADPDNNWARYNEALALMQTGSKDEARAWSDYIAHAADDKEHTALLANARWRLSELQK